MDKKTRNQLAQEYTRLTKKIGRVLRRFTPIDPTDQYSMGDDYDCALEKIVSLLLRDSNRDELLRILAQTRQEAEVAPDPEKDGRIADAVLKSAKMGTPPPKPKLAFRLDLRNDQPHIESYIVKRVQAFDPRLNQGPGDSKSVSQIIIAFECSQTGWVAIIFDTRPDPSNYGEWTLYLDRVATLTRDRGVFSDLPIAPGCQFFIEDFDGEYFWPDCETVGTPNMVST